MKKLLFYFPLLLAFAFVAVGCDKDEENTIDNKLVGSWKLVKTAYGTVMKADTTIVTNEVIVDVLSDGRYWITTDGSKSDRKTLHTYQGSYRGISIEGTLLQASNDIEDTYKYLFSEDNNTLILRSYSPYIKSFWGGFKSYIFQRIE